MAFTDNVGLIWNSNKTEYMHILFKVQTWGLSMEKSLTFTRMNSMNSKVIVELNQGKLLKKSSTISKSVMIISFHVLLLFYWFSFK